MFSNYFKTAWRILIRQKLFSLINIFGLAIGMAGCLLIIQYISFEKSYDNFHTQGENIYRIKHQNYSQGNLIENSPKTYSAVGPALVSEFPEVRSMTRVSKFEGQVSTRLPGGLLKVFNERSLYAVDPSFLRLFSFSMLKGSVDALDQPNTVVITNKTAKKYFPNETPIGKIINIQQQVSGTNIIAKVTGVTEDVPANSHLQFDFLVSTDIKAGDWIYPDFYTYILLNPSTKPAAFEARLPAFIKKYTALSSDKTNSTQTLGKSNLANIFLSLQPLHDIHLYSNLSEEISTGGNGKLVLYLGIIAILILVIAYINYINLSTAKCVERAKEVGIRKVLGSGRMQLVKQFLFESLMLNIISVAIAIFFVVISMPWFSELCGVQIGFTLWRSLSFLLGLVSCLFFGIAISAIYPAAVLSNYRPVQILKGKFLHTSKGATLRKSLVVFQFAATATFIIGTFVVYRQVNFMKTENKGMDMKQTLIVVAPQNLRTTDQDANDYSHNDSVFQTEILRNPHIQSITSSSSIPGENIGYIMSYKRQSQTGEGKGLRLSTFEIGSAFVDQFKLQLVAGNKFLPGNKGSGLPMMLNEAAVISLGFKDPQDAIGKFVETKNGRGRIFENEVVGVIRNFHQNSLKEAFSPIVFRLIDPSSVTHYEVKIDMSNLSQSIAQVEKTYKAIFPDAAFDYFFLDEFFDQQYRVEQHFGQVFSLFSGFAVIVACLGLFGLMLITVTQRIKEIGIRKILGASIPDILMMLSKDFMGLILIANIIAFPLAYWGSYTWLQNYAFRIKLDAWFFLIPMVVVFLVAILTVSMQAIKAALANPVESLRAE